MPTQDEEDRILKARAAREKISLAAPATSSATNVGPWARQPAGTMAGTFGGRTMTGEEFRRSRPPRPAPGQYLARVSVSEIGGTTAPPLPGAPTVPEVEGTPVLPEGGIVERGPGTLAAAGYRGYSREQAPAPVPEAAPARPEATATFTYAPIPAAAANSVFVTGQPIRRIGRTTVGQDAKREETQRQGRIADEISVATRGMNLDDPTDVARARDLLKGVREKWGEAAEQNPVYAGVLARAAAAPSVEQTDIQTTVKTTGASIASHLAGALEGKAEDVEALRTITELAGEEAAGSPELKAALEKNVAWRRAQGILGRPSTTERLKEVEQTRARQKLEPKRRQLIKDIMAGYPVEEAQRRAAELAGEYEAVGLGGEAGVTLTPEYVGKLREAVETEEELKRAEKAIAQFSREKVKSYGELDVAAQRWQQEYGEDTPLPPEYDVRHDELADQLYERRQKAMKADRAVGDPVTEMQMEPVYVKAAESLQASTDPEEAWEGFVEQSTTGLGPYARPPSEKFLRHVFMEEAMQSLPDDKKAAFRDWARSEGGQWARIERLYPPQKKMPPVPPALKALMEADFGSGLKERVARVVAKHVRGEILTEEEMAVLSDAEKIVAGKKPKEATSEE